LLGTFLGLVIGLVLVWLCIRGLNYYDSLHPSNRVSQTCGDYEHCGGPWWVVPSALVAWLSPVIAFAWAGFAAAARQWSLRKQFAVGAAICAATFTGTAAMALLA